VPVLLDTHAFLWWCQDDRRLSRRARKTISQEDCLLSVASMWEMAVKISLGRLTLPARLEAYVPEQMRANGFEQLEIGIRHLAGCAALPWHHRDPFDRLLAAQALAEDLAMVSQDKVMEEYGVQRVW
jgi:PIN domain nuclease of toxin-antitoxin system